LKKTDLEKAVNDGSRKISLRGSQAIVPLKFDSDGEIVSEQTPSHKLVLKRLTLLDLAFLKAWKENEYKSAEEACSKAGITPDHAERLSRKLACFREEDAKVKALAEIPTPSWIAEKHVSNVYDETLTESQHKSLSELAKINGAYKTQNQPGAVTVNVFNLPKLDPESERKLKEVARQEAQIIQEAQIVNAHG
jgi:hypothetical protein